MANSICTAMFTTRRSSKMGEIEKYLENNGYQVKEVRWDVVTKKLKAAHGHEDLEFSLEEIGVKGKVL